MITEFVERFMSAKDAMLVQLAAAHPDGYDDLVKRVFTVVGGEDDYNSPDPDRITTIDHGDYQGTKLYIAAAKGYQPSEYWAIFVDYGSCSGCDTFEATRMYSDAAPSPQQVTDYWTMMLHMVQGMTHIGRPAEQTETPQ